MVRRSLGAVLWFLAGLLACFLGALAALTGTGAGRALLAKAASGALGAMVDGRVEIGDVRGSLLTGVVFFEVRLYDADRSLVVRLPRAELSYNPFDLAGGRLVFQEVRLTRPWFDLRERADGRLNLAALFRLGVRDSTRPSRPAALIWFRNVEIADGSLILRLPDRRSAGDSRLEIDSSGGDGRRRVRRFERLQARLASLRVSSPRERGIRADITRLAMEISDPAVRLRHLAGRVRLVGDSLELDLETVRLPGSDLAVTGRLSWPHGPVLYELDIAADSATLSDLWWVDPRFPAGAVLRGTAQLRSHGARLLEVRLDPLDLTYAGGLLSGRVTAFSLSDSGLVRLRQGDLSAANFDLEFARPFLDTLPFAGRLDGRTVVDGPVGGLELDIDWAFRDSLVPGRPETRLRGRGTVDLLDPAGLAFRPFAVAAATVDLGTVRRLVPAFALNGVLDGAGTLTGPYRNAEFSGTLQHRDHPRPASLVRGVLRLDSRGETLGVFADVSVDSLSLAGLRGSFPTLPFTTALIGTIRLDGDLAALDTHADLAAAWGGGRVRVDGTLTLFPPRYGARDVTLRAADLDLRRWLERGPSTRLTLTAAASFRADSAAAPVGTVTATLAPSLFAGSPLDGGAAAVRLADGRMMLDSLRIFQPGLITSGVGALGWARPATGTLSLDFDADSLSSLDSLVAWAAGRFATAPDTGEALAGVARATVTLDGSFDSLGMAVRVAGTRLRWRGWTISAGEARAVFGPDASRPFDVALTLDSLGHGRFGFGAVAVGALGVRDSFTWFARSRVGDLGAVLAGGRYANAGDTTAVGVDSLAVLVPGDIWFLQKPVDLRFGRSTVTVPEVELRGAGGTGRLAFRGTIPARGPIEASAQLEGFPLAGAYALLERDTAGVGGRISTTVSLAGTRADPRYAGSFALNDGSFGAFRTPFMDGTIDYRDRRLDAALHLWRSGQQVLAVSAHLPLDLALAPVPRRQLPDTLSVRATADSVDLAVLEALTPMVRQVRGDFSADLGIGGTWAAPVLRGGLRLADAAATIPALSVRYEDVSGRLTLSGDTIRVDTVRARSGQGRAEVTGFVRLPRLTRPDLALDIRADEFKALELRGYLSVTASGRLTLTGPVFGATLAGQGTVTNGVLYFADLVTKRVVNLDEPWVQSLIDTSLANAIRRQRLGPEFESRFLDSLRIQGLQLAMGSNVWLRSTEANIQLSGTASVSKERDAYRLTGTLQAPRGIYRLIVGPVTREFIVTQGTVRYFGTPDLDAELNIEARHVVHPLPGPTQSSTEDITVIAHIGGTLLVPKLTLTAERQQLSQTELISYLLFGKPSFELAGDQGAFSNQTAVLRSTVAGLLSGELERTLVSDLGVPLDYVEIRPGTANDPFSGALLAAGWQIGRKTFLGLNAGFCQGREVSARNTLGASLQFRLSPEWRTEASFEPIRTCGDPLTEASTKVQRQLGLDLLWERRY